MTPAAAAEENNEGKTTMAVTVEMVRQLREETGAGVMACKRALTKTDGDMAGAKKLLEAEGLAAASKLAQRATSEGRVAAYVHPGDRIGVLVELSCETDFVARTSEFADLAHEVALQVAAMQPLYVSEADLPADSPDREDLTPDRRATLFLAEQPYIRDPGKTIGQLVTEASAKTGENIQVRRFVRYELSQATDRSEQAE